MADHPTSTPPEGVDYAHTDHAEANRRIKARRIAAWCWSRAITASDLDRLDAGGLRRIADQADVNPPSRVSRTWGDVKVLLERMAAWAAAHPDDPRAAQPYAGLRHTWIPTTPTHPQEPPRA